MNNNKQPFNLFSKVFMRAFTAVMVGRFFFVFIDNFILIISGQEIDSARGSLGYSVLFRAGLGNTISDAVGVIGGSFMALMVVRMFGEVDQSKYSSKMLIFAETVGIILGCLAGLIPLAFMS